MTTTKSLRISATGLNGYGFTWHPERSEWIGEDTDTSGREYNATEADLPAAIETAKGTLLEGVELIDVNADLA